ncbi:pre-mRNA 3'-end-processing factor FIP1-like [Ambystoma mexicanum]|uniref:pre-mRNA 3'-end-processing factor FIP1-like n=1 Tax=Ambystoma mexicanum TaxID=8296 RepID=UPI0037E791A5
MATELEPPGEARPEEAAPMAAGEDEEEHWLYGDDPTGKKRRDGPMSRRAVPSNTLQDDPMESEADGSKGAEVVQKVVQSEEEDSDSDSDEDDVKVTIGNIKTGAASYMATSFKTGRNYGGSISAKLPSKGIDLDAPGHINGLPVIEVDLDSFEDKPWRKPGADLSDYFNYGFNEDTWKAYCEKQKRLQLGLDSTPPLSPENSIMVHSGITGHAEHEHENDDDDEAQSDFNSEFAAQAAGHIKAGPPPNRKLAGTIDVIGGHSGSIRRVEGRRREMLPSEENTIQVIGDAANNPQPPQQPVPQPVPQQPMHQQPPPQAPHPHLPFVTPTGPLPHRPPIVRMPPPHFMHPPPPMTHVHPPMHPTGLPPPSPMRGMYPPPQLAPPPALLIQTLDGPANRYNRHPPSFGYNPGDGNYMSFPALGNAHTSWVTTADKGTNNSSDNNWQYSGSRRDRDRDRERDRPRTPPRTPPGHDHSRNDDERYHYYSKERNYEYDREYRRSRDHSRDREDRHRERRHREKEEPREKEEVPKHKSSRRKPHETEEVETHRRHKHKKNKRNKDDKVEDDGSPLRDERVFKE